MAASSTLIPKQLVHPDRHQLPDIRPSITHRRTICGYKCYITVSFFGGHQADLIKPAEVFVKVAKHGSMIGGLLDGFCTVISTSLQYGVPWEPLKQKLLHHVFERNGDTENTSLLDGLAKGVDYVIEQHRAAVFGDEPVRAAAATTGPTDPDGPEEPPAGSAQVVSPRAPQGTDGAPAETPPVHVKDIPRMTTSPRMVGGAVVFADIRPVYGFGGGPFVTSTHEDLGSRYIKQRAIYEDGSEWIMVTDLTRSREFWWVGDKCYDMDGVRFSPGTWEKRALPSTVRM